MNMKEIEFQTASYEQWKEEAVKALKGKSFESLFTKTIENITLDPLYTEESLIEKLGRATGETSINNPFFNKTDKLHCCTANRWQ